MAFTRSLSQVSSQASPPRGFVPAAYVGLLYAHLRDCGIDGAQLLGAPQPAAGALDRTSVATWKQWLERAAQHLDDPLLGLKLGRRITPAHLGVMGYVLLSAPNLGGSLDRLQRYQRLLYDVNPLQLRQEAGSLVLEWGTENGRPGPLVDETAIVALVQFAREITSRHIELREVSFVNPAPARLRPYREYFGCAVHFNAASTRIALPSAALALPLRKPDAVLLGVLEAQAMTLLAALPDGDDWVQRTRYAIARLARTGEPSLSRVAAELQTTPRTLHRRLEASALNFHALREDTRRCLAEDYLRDTRLQLGEVAQLLGYAEQSAFNRAFRRWTGSTPRVFRMRARRTGPIS